MIKEGDNKGVSPIIGTVLIVGITVVIAAFIWVVVNNLVISKTKSSSCFDAFDKVKINEGFSCYNVSSKEALVFIEVKDISLDALLVSIVSEGKSSTFKILNETSQINGVLSYPERNTQISLPKKNSGKTYIVNLTYFGLNNTDIISVAPIINGNQCEISDSLEDVSLCSI
jgi:flagellin-like protein